MKSSLLVVGSVAFDSIASRAGKREEILGGAATYIALAARHFAPVQLVGVVGRDDFPAAHVDMLTARGIDVEGLERAEGRTFRWKGVYADDFSSRTTLDTQLGVFETFSPRIPKGYMDSRVLLLGNIHPSVQLQVLDQMGSDCFIITDTMNLWIDVALDELKKVISRTHILVINDEESLLLSGEMQVKVAAARILEMGPKALIIKRGEHGAWLFTRDDLFFAPAIPLDSVVDPTGAGDSFAGGLAGYLAGQNSAALSDIKKGMLYGTAVASATCEAFGTEKTSALSKEEVDALYSMLRRIVSVE